MMNLGLRAHDVQIFDDVPNLAKQLKQLGFNSIQFAPRVSLQKTTQTGANVSFGLANQVKWDFAQQGVQIAVLGCYVNIIHPDEKQRAQALAQFKRYLARVTSFGGVLVGTETGSVDPDFNLTPANYKPEVVALAIKQIKAMAAEAEKLGVLVGIEPGVNHPLHDLTTTKQMLDEVASPNVKIILDAGNLATPAATDIVATIKQALDLFGDQIYAYHLKDFVMENGRPQGVPVGEGIADLQGAVKLIDQAQPGAYVILDETPQEQFTRSIERFKAMAEYK
ncbi:sugar phosphate isomerase/epimerase family protein [Loigolactobacillus jiayinensis]|uniref:Sugar phosphate isomerase/epimerase family protein n=1 Tax=Loigolactobacillus jiayinensis TaxID=2486016 RepID=A0ABW1RCV8_9LACO|nr:sugar phosphate isomerase/epimerase family protein [Loigolactobacillus jiayinensis]